MRRKQGSLKAADVHCMAKRQKLEVAETKTERTSNDERPVDSTETDAWPNNQALSNGDADKRLGECMTVANELCPENPRRDPIELEEKAALEVDHYCVNDSFEEAEESEMKMQIQVDSSIFLDDDSNQVMPVEQFFGNIELVQDYPARTPASVPMSRREYRRLHFIAKDDSDEDVYEDNHLETPQQSDSLSSTTQSGSSIRNGSRGSASQGES
ncbi:hypothetical protein AAFF_G00165800 [Aldrovandia affinis]|uniref:CA174 protein n=1 Tax=Aldrovandia affinis TaxID=143900 RepID=A0AAD7W8K3_9TELE|nr:hypothetical protein AAFF_G00165800 [Aldrovandia affinis]